MSDMALNTKLRHPLCPECRYDLIATVAVNRRICPECGYEFDLDELRHQARPGDWTVWVGFRRAAVALGIRMALAGSAWCAVLWAFALFHTVFPAAAGPFTIVFMVVFGALVGWIISRNLVDQTGFASMIIVFAACLAAALSISVATILLASRLPGLTSWYLVIGGAILAWSCIIKVMVLDET